jgi:hypothetical protein
MNDLLKELKLSSLDWKGYLLSGLGPVVVFCLGAILCLQGPTAVEDTLTSLFRKPSEFAVKSATVVSACLVAAAILYGLRPVTIDFFRRFPIPGIRWLMVELSAWNKKRAEESLWIALWRIDVARWCFSEFDCHQYLSPLVRKRKTSVKLLDVLKKSAQARSYILNSNAFLWWFRKRKVFRQLQNLHLLAGRRTLVEDYAATLAQTSNRTDEQNWEAAEEFFGFTAPGESFYQEIDQWRIVYHDSSLSGERIRSLEDHRLSEAYRRAVARSGNYPSQLWVGPTRLANILAALEDYAADRYGMDTELLWSRLEPTVVKEQREQLANYQRALSALLHMCAALTLLGIFAGVRSYLQQDRRALLVAIGALVLSRLSLSAAEYAAAGYVSKIEAAVDLGIAGWLRGIGVPFKDASSRLAVLQQLGRFFSGGTALPNDFVFVPPAERKPEAKDKAE